MSDPAQDVAQEICRVQSEDSLSDQGEQDRLPEELARTLEETVVQKRGAIGPVRQKDDDADSDDEQLSSHSHEKGMSASLIAALASGLINYLLMFGLCCAYGMIMFDDANARHRALGVKMNLCTAMAVGLSLAIFCNIKVAIGGPDLNPVVFIAGFVTEMAKDIALQLELEYPTARRLAASSSSSSAAIEWCNGAHAEQYMAECTEYHEQLRSTVIFAVAFSSAALGLLFFLSGRFKSTRYASYVPTCVMEAFLSCVGYKVFTYALHFCNYDVKQFAPSAMIGVPLYFVKAYHVGNPAIVIPLMLFIPLAIFYAAVFGSGKDLEHAEISEWMFPRMENVEFWAVWEWSIGSPSKINFKAWLKTMPLLAVYLVVCFLDCVLKVLGTESKLPVKVDKDRELQIFGLSNLLTAFSGSSVGYMQLKFNMINAGILGTAHDRRGGLVYGVLSAVTWFWTIEHFNFLPRFFLSTLLFFAGAGFVAENLWGSRRYLSIGEWLQIVVILAVFVVSEDLLAAVLVGILLTCVDFILTYARVPCVVETPVRRAELSCVRRAPMVQLTLDHVLNSWLLVVRLKGFIFFASAQTLVAQIREMMEFEARTEVPYYRRLHFVIFDCSVMDGMDASTAKVLRKLKSEAASHDVVFLWTHVDEELESKLRRQELVMVDQQSGDQQTHLTFADTDEALHSVEDHILSYQAAVHDRWLKLHPSFSAYQRLAEARTAFEPFAEVFPDDTCRHGCPWRYCCGVGVKQYSTLLWTPGQTNVGLFLVHSGAVALFRELPDLSGDAMKAWRSPIAVYTQGWFLNRESLMSQPTRYYAVALEDGELVTWSRSQWKQMAREMPRMAFDIAHAVMKQQAADAEHSSCNKQEDFLPEVMHHRMKAIRTARALGAFRIYDAPDGEKLAPLPPMPMSLQNSVDMAFATFCDAGPPSMDRVPSLAKGHACGDGDGSKVPDGAMLPVESVVDALMFTGIFNVAPSIPAGALTLSLSEFEEVAHEAAMLRLSEAQAERLTKFFNDFDKDGTGNLGLIELADALTSAFSHKFEPDELEPLMSEWMENTTKLDVTKFLALTSRLARILEQDWHLLQGMSEVLYKSAAPPMGPSTRARITAQALHEAAPGLTEEEVAEMLWTADWRTGGKRGGKSVEFCDMLCAVLQPPQRQQGRLPPLVGETQVDVAGRQIIYSEADPQRGGMRQSATDSEDHAKPHFTSYHSVGHEDGKHLKPTCRRRLYVFLEDPTSSTAAQIFWLVMGMFILLSVFIMVLHPLLSPTAWAKPEAWKRQDEQRVWWILEACVTIAFTIEYVLRVIVADSMRTQTTLGFIVKPYNICELLAILPFYIEFLVSGEASKAYEMLRFVRLLRLSRIMRISRLAKKHPLFGPVLTVMLVIWFIYLKTDLKAA